MGSAEKTVLKAFHPDAEGIFNVTCDLRGVCAACADRTKRVAVPQVHQRAPAGAFPSLVPVMLCHCITVSLCPCDAYAFCCGFPRHRGFSLRQMSVTVETDSRLSQASHESWVVTRHEANPCEWTVRFFAIRTPTLPWSLQDISPGSAVRPQLAFRATSVEDIWKKVSRGMGCTLYCTVLRGSVVQQGGLGILWGKSSTLPSWAGLMGNSETGLFSSHHYPIVRPWQALHVGLFHCVPGIPKEIPMSSTL